MLNTAAKLKENIFENPEQVPTRDGFGKALLELGESNPNVVALCAETNLTSHLAKYLFELAKLANQYYESTRILDDSATGSGQVDNHTRRNGRLLLIAAVSHTLTAGLRLLGIAVPQRI